MGWSPPAQAISHAKPEAPVLWASLGINKQHLGGAGRVEEGGPSWSPDAGMASA